MRLSRDVWRALPFAIALCPVALWLVAQAIYASACGDWCMICTRRCVILGMNADWVMTLGLVLSPALLLVSIPLGITAAFARWWFVRRKAHSA